MSAQTPRHACAPHGGQAPLILVADDESTQRLLTRDHLEREGYRVIEAPDGNVALGASTRRRPSCST